MKLWFNKKRIIIYSVLLILIIVAVVLTIYFNRYSANVILDSAINKVCTSEVEIKKDNPEGTIKLIEQKYGIAYPKTTNQKEYWVDMDTYAKSWQDFGLEDARVYLKSHLPQILAEARKIYGEPYKKNRVVVILDEYFETGLFNRYGVINAGALSDDSINAIYLSKISFSNGRENYDVETFIHEIMHTFNDGSLPIEALEEGMVESTAQIVSNIVFSTPVPEKKDYSGREIIKSSLGFFRTQQDSTLTGLRYNAAADYFKEMLGADTNFIKDFRAKYAKSNYYLGNLTWQVRGGRRVAVRSNLSMSNEPYKFMQHLIGKSVCDEVTGHLPEYRAYLAYMQNLLKPGLGQYNKSQEAKDYLAKYPILDVMPSEYIYPEKPPIYIDISNDNGFVNIRSLYKVANIKDFISSLHKKLYPDRTLERHYGLTSGFPRLMNSIANSSNLNNMSMQEIGFAIEENADRLDIEVSNWADEKVLFTKEITTDSLYRGPLYGFSLMSELIKAGYKEYDGKVIVKVKAHKTVDRGVREYKCAGFIIGKTCVSTGLKFIKQDLSTELVREFDVSYQSLIEDVLEDITEIKDDQKDPGELSDKEENDKPSVWPKELTWLPEYSDGTFSGVNWVEYVGISQNWDLYIENSSEKYFNNYINTIQSSNWTLERDESIKDSRKYFFTQGNLELTIYRSTITGYMFISATQKEEKG